MHLLEKGGGFLLFIHNISMYCGKLQYTGTFLWDKTEKLRNKDLHFHCLQCLIDNIYFLMHVSRFCLPTGAS